MCRKRGGAIKAARAQEVLQPVMLESSPLHKRHTHRMQTSFQIPATFVFCRELNKSVTNKLGTGSGVNLIPILS